MLHCYLSRSTLIFLSGTLAVLSFGCREDNKNTALVGGNDQPAQMNNLAAEPSVGETAPATSPETESQTRVKISPTYFELGLDKAIGGLSISQSAQSSADWRLVANQYQDAIALMKQVQEESPDFALAQRKITEYQLQAKYAQEKATLNPLLTTSPEPEKIVVAVPEASPLPKFILRPLPQPVRIQVKKLPPTVSSPPQTLNQAKEKEHQEVFSVPIKRRIGGTPIIEVTFNGNQQFEMIVDTGASGTVITQQMASSLGVVSVGKAKANTASSKAVEFSIGYVDTIEAGGVSVNKVAVAIAGSDLETGLLGHDFFGNYDLTIKRDVVEFRPHEDLQSNSPETQLTVPTSPKQRRIVEYP